MLRLPRFSNLLIKQLPCKSSSSSFFFLCKSTMHLAYFSLFFHFIILIINKILIILIINFIRIFYYEIITYPTILKFHDSIIFRSLCVNTSFSLYHFITLLSKSIFTLIFLFISNLHLHHYFDFCFHRNFYFHINLVVILIFKFKIFHYFFFSYDFSDRGGFYLQGMYSTPMEAAMAKDIALYE